MLTHILLEKTSNEADDNIKNIVASAMSKYFAWRPTEYETKALLAMCHSNLALSWPTMAVSSPTSVALARAGCPDILKRTISRLIMDVECGTEDFDRVEKFYGNEVLQFHAVLSHFEDSNRTGLIWANDTNTLLMLARSETLPSEYKRAIGPKLSLCGKLLFDAGLEEEARKARDTVEYLDRQLYAAGELA
jgi:hypothetical protein